MIHCISRKGVKLFIFFYVTPSGSPTIANDSYYSANSSGLFVYKFYPLCKRCFSRYDTKGFLIVLLYNPVRVI